MDRVDELQHIADGALKNRERAPGGSLREATARLEHARALSEIGGLQGQDEFTLAFDARKLTEAGERLERLEGGE